ADPTRGLKQLGSGGRWIQLVGALSGLLASLQSSVAAATADEASDQAGQAADEASYAATAAQAMADADASPATDERDAEQPLPRCARRLRDPRWDRRPAAVGAATEVAER